MKSKRSHEGYLMIDHRACAGMPGQMPRLFEAPTITCRHCQVVVILNPARTRERAYCTGCDHYLCDNCGAVRAITGECNNIEKQIEQLQEQAIRSLQSGIIV